MYIYMWLLIYVHVYCIISTVLTFSRPLSVHTEPLVILVETIIIIIIIIISQLVTHRMNGA